MTFQNITEEELQELIELQRRSKNEPIYKMENRAVLQKLQEEANPMLIEQLRGVRETIEGKEEEEEAVKGKKKVSIFKVKKEQKRKLFEELKKYGWVKPWEDSSVKEMLDFLEDLQQQEKKEEPTREELSFKKKSRSELFVEAKLFGWKKPYRNSSTKEMENYLQDIMEQETEEPKRKEFEKLSTEAGNDPSTIEEEEEYLPEFETEEEEEEVKKGKGYSAPKNENMEKVAKEFIKILEGGVNNNKQLKRLLVLSNKLIKYKYITKQEFEKLVSG